MSVYYFELSKSKTYFLYPPPHKKSETVCLKVLLLLYKENLSNRAVASELK